MAERTITTGSKDDVVVDVSRCLRTRFSESGCSRCIDLCPHGAIILDGGLVVNPDLCSGCLLCTAVCPVGALEQKSDFSECLPQLSRAPDPVLGCVRTKEQASATVACLGGLSEEYLLALSHTLSGQLTLNLSLCQECPNGATIPLLLGRVAALAEAGLLPGTCQVLIAETPGEIRYHPPSVDRRTFFKSLRNSLFQGAATVLSTTHEQAERHTGYTEKRVPARKELLNRIMGLVPSDQRPLLGHRYEHHIVFSGTCTACHGCVAICPTGALLTDSPDAPPRFHTRNCTGCGLCAEFCLDDALTSSASTCAE